MPTKRMLIDAAHPEETRVVVLTGNRLEEFDVESETRKQLKGNIYLAKVTRVEPSLQAAFVEYGGNRHGFLPFGEIHPDYFQVPVDDRRALIAEHDAAEMAAEAEGAEEAGGGEEASVETLGGVDDEDVVIRRQLPSHRNYKIQEVIKRRQILLVQVVKEERGTKGAALTTYLSLAGRYCVLMPNTPRGGGISRKIGSGADRKRLKSILGDLEIAEGMAVIVRTAGAERGKAEIKRDYEYLVRLWDQVRTTTLESTAPALVYEEGNLVKRSIRDLYSRDIDEIIVEGDEAYRFAKDFMRLLIPSHAKKVQPYKDEGMPLFQRYQVESQLDAMHSPHVQLKSGGYIVISPTEALVAIDVNSGRSTRERNIEETALRTNLEAADEIARQLRLRDLAGLIVIDFIDMEVTRNQIQVERRLKEAMRTDRARIQIGRISPFGLLELSRQRLRPSLLETSSEPCPHCGGTGVRRSTESAALTVLRAIEEEGMRRRSDEVVVHMATAIALYILNQKREALGEIEARHEFRVCLAADDELIPPEHRIERLKPRTAREGSAAVEEERREDKDVVEAPEPSEDEEGQSEEATSGDASSEPRDEGSGRRRRRRRPRRRRRNGDDREARSDSAQDTAADDGSEEIEGEDASPEAGEYSPAEESPAEEGTVSVPAEARSEEDAEEHARKRRRGRRGGRRRSRKDDQPEDLTNEPETAPAEVLPEAVTAEPESKPLAEPPFGAMSEPERSFEPESEPEPVPAPLPEPEPEPRSEPEPSSDEARREASKTIVIDVGAGAGGDEEGKPRRRGWWQRPDPS